MKKYIATTLSLAISLIALGQAGELDLAFNGDGIFTQSFNNDAWAETVAVQPDGKILIGGSLENNSNNDDLLIMRLDEYGNPDLSFGTQGYTSVDYAGDDEVVMSIVVTQNDQIITLAECDSANVTGALLSRFFSNGQLDVSFGNQGHLFVFAPANSYSNTWNDMALLADGSILAVGRINATGGNRGGILKVSAQGQVDQSFGTNGLMLLENNGQNVDLRDIELLPNGDFFVLGSTTLQGSLALYVAKFNSTGNPITNFGGNGVIVLGLPGAPTPKHLLVKPDGKLLITGQAYVNGWSQIITIQLLTSGSLDQTYGTNGQSSTQILYGHTNANATAFLPDGKLMLTGSADGPWNEDFALARLQPNGNLDLSFHFDGFATKNIGGGNDYVADAALLQNGRMVLVGNSASQSDNDISVARFLTGYSSAVDLPENNDLINLSVYPNPSSEWFKVDLDERYREVQIRLFNAQGREVLSQIINPLERINISHLPNGLYIIQVQTSSGEVKAQKINIFH